MSKSPGPVDPLDPLLAKLAALPSLTPGELQRARVRRRAHEVLAEEQQLARWPSLRPVRRAWRSAVLPALLAGTVGVYLVWAVRFTSALYR